MSELNIVPMQRRHLAALARLEALCFQSPWSEQALGAELSNDGALFLVAEHNGVPVGYVGAHQVLDEGAIADLAVDPAYRRQGVGKALLQALREEGQRRGLAFLTLEVRISNFAAIGLYQKLGFQNQGRRKNAFDHPREDGFVMTLFLT